MKKYRGNDNIVSEKKSQMDQGTYRGVSHDGSSEKKVKNNKKMIYRGQQQG